MTSGVDWLDALAAKYANRPLYQWRCYAVVQQVRHSVDEVEDIECNAVIRELNDDYGECPKCHRIYQTWDGKEVDEPGERARP